jgi:hypothetical protein
MSSFVSFACYFVSVTVKASRNDTVSYKKRSWDIAQKLMLQDWAGIIFNSAKGKITMKEAEKIARCRFSGSAKSAFITKINPPRNLLDTKPTMHTVTYRVTQNNLKKSIEEAWDKNCD